MLEVRDLQTAYGRSQVLFGVDLDVQAGAGGDAPRPQRHGQDHHRALDHGHHARRRSGRCSFEGKADQGLPSYRIAQAGIGLVPEGRQVFPNLTVRENLVATRDRVQPRWTSSGCLTLSRS